MVSGTESLVEGAALDAEEPEGPEGGAELLPAELDSGGLGGLELVPCDSDGCDAALCVPVGTRAVLCALGCWMGALALVPGWPLPELETTGLGFPSLEAAAPEGAGGALTPVVAFPELVPLADGLGWDSPPPHATKGNQAGASNHRR